MSYVLLLMLFGSYQLDGDFIFDAVLYAVKFGSSFCKVQYKHMKTGCGAVYMCLFQTLGYVSAVN